MVIKRNVFVVFIKNHKALTVLFVISFMIMLKNSGLIHTEMPILNILNVPEGDKLIKAANLTNVFAGSYIMGVLMLLFLEDIPKEQRRRESMKIIYPHVKQLLFELYTLKEMIRVSTRDGDYNHLYFTDELVYVNVKVNGEDGFSESFSLVSYSNMYAKGIRRDIRDIIETPVIRDADERLLIVLSEIVSEKHFSLSTPGFVAPGIIITSLSEVYELLVHSIEVIDSLYYDLIKLEYCIMTEKEIYEYFKKLGKLSEKER